jgi:hypothetical protein
MNKLSFRQFTNNNQNKETRILFIILGLIGFLSLLSMINGITIESLLLDEAFFARNLNHFPQGLFIGTAPTAPLFYFITYGFISLFGKAEWVYRLLPLLSCFIGIGFMIFFLYKHFSNFVFFISSVLLLSSVPLIHYAGNAHPYASDFMCSVVLLFFASKVIQDSRSRNWYYWLIIVFLFMPLSYPVLFVVVPYAFIFLIKDVLNKNNIEFRRKFISMVPLALYIIFIVIFVFMKQSGLIETQFTSNHPDYFPKSWLPWHVFKWAFINTIKIIEYFFFNYLGGLAGFFLSILGIAWFIDNKKYYLLCLNLSPVFIAFFAALLHKWPYTPIRTMLFSLPFFLIFISGGIELIWNLLKKKSIKYIVALAFITLLIPQSYILTKGFKKVHDSEEAIRTLAREIKPEILNDDTFLIYYAAEVQFRFYFPEYLDRAVIQSWAAKEDKDFMEKFVESNLNNIKNRFWMIFSHINNQEDEFMIGVVKKYCSSIKEYQFPGCKAFLINFSKE